MCIIEVQKVSKRGTKLKEKATRSKRQGMAEKMQIGSQTDKQ